MNPGWRILDFTQFEGSICYRRGRLIVQKDGESENVSVPLTQVAVILIGNQTSISGAVLTKLSEYDIALLVSNWRNIPLAGVMPWREHTRIGARQRAQSELSLPRRKSAWSRIVRAKILGQAATIAAFSSAASAELFELAKTVRSGDPENIEAQAARRYWHAISQQHKGFRREPGGGGGGLNSCLDYAYTVLRGHGIRAAVSAGLSGTLAVFHRGRDNPFALVDDLIEPFRPAVDAYVLDSGVQSGIDLALPEVRGELVAAVDATFRRTGETIPTVLTSFSQEYGLYVEGQRKTLEVPVWRGDVRASERY
ncbi:type II CRISPR-associated endonuclease Cas1 [Corynebacterium sp. P6129]|uniref:type II CRISPR-associated endonuclease Cas1 n=1 Tax=Corynebacterium antarcticum TaxID=2800405 RepID=UPI002260A8C1|nr:type II CRISPR-associated endonuclease Cas1 [Corynebacterium antarcticum]MCX7492877.1 type II CRISPR-associated endonuclease Cas1 [Corynebacterium antarcticum]